MLRTHCSCYVRDFFYPRRSVLCALQRIVQVIAFLVCALCLRAEAGVRAKHAMVVSAHELASQAGVEILQQGGNAIDAAVATGYALAVVFPEAGNIGGGGFALIRLKDGKSFVVDFREMAPGKATGDMYLDSNGEPTNASIDGYLAGGIPGTVAGFEKMLALAGKMNIKTVIQPSIKLAEEGFIVDRNLEENLEDYKDGLLQYPSTAKIFSRNGTMLNEGDTLVQLDLAATLRRIQQQGADGFYSGVTAKLIADDMARNGGLITEEDLLQYKAVVRTPVIGTYRGYEILSVPPPSGGGICLLQMLSIMERFSFVPSDYHSSRTIHLMAEAMKRAYADRQHYAADPDVETVPVERLLSAEYLNTLKYQIDTFMATPAASVQHGALELREGDHTTHYVVADDEGNVVSVTYTINDLFGSKAIIEGTGFFLNDEMDDFATKPGVPNIYGLVGTNKNAIAPGKRPVSSMTPTIVVKDNMPVVALGARGGPRIINAIFQTLVNVIDFKMDIERAVNEPRFHHQLFPDTLRYEQFCFPDDVVKNITQRGHILKATKSSLASVQALYRDQKTGWLYSGADRREGGTAAGY